MSNKKNSSSFSELRNDIPAGIVVLLVAIPLCLGIALASGAPLFSGIISGIVGGVVVTLMSRSPLGVSGPAAGLAVIVLSAIQELGSFEVFLFAVVIAGFIQIILGIAKAGVIGYYFPSSVIKGMLSGIGIIIILKQIPHAFGYDADPEGDFSFFQMDGHNTISELGYMFDAISPGALIVALVSIGILIMWEQPFMKKIPIFKLVQGPLVAVAAGIGLNLLFQDHESLRISAEHLVSIPVAESISGFFAQFTTPDFSRWLDPQIYVIALTLAVVASLETLLCVEATDKLDPQKRVTPTNRELIAQGAGNVVSGLIGGLPLTQVIVRSSANIQSGGKTKASAFTHGILLLLCAIAIPHVLNLVPLASLAAILLVVGFKLAKPALFKEMFALGKGQFIPFMVTIVGIVFTDLLVGIGLGMTVAIIQILWNNYKRPYHFDPREHMDDETITIKMGDNVSFLNKAGILHTLNIIPNDRHVIIDLHLTKSVHPDVLEIISDFRENAKTRNITVELIGNTTEHDHDPIERFGQVVPDEPHIKKRSVFSKTMFNF